MVRPRMSRIYYQGKFYDYPLRAMNALGNLGPLEALRCVLSYLWVRIRPPKDQSHFEGWTAQESKPLLDFLYTHAARPEFQTRFRWEEGSIAFWDNRATWHYALNDYHGERRLMHRIIEAVASHAKLMPAEPIGAAALPIGQPRTV